MNEFIWCHGSKCHKSHTQDRIRGSKGSKVLRTRNIYMTTLKEIQSKEDSPSLSDAQKFVGGWVECVHLDTGTLIIDEEGKLKDKPVNEVASKMYADKYGDADIIVGDAIFIPNGIPSDWHR
jgi:hypothetical protein